jgi:malate-CoA ligase subunit alpha
MSIFLDETTPVIVQGYTGRIGSFHAQEMIDYGTNVVGGVTPGKGGERHLDRPVFNTVKDAVRDTGAEASVVFVPPPFAADAIMEAADAGIRFCVCVTDGIPAQDMMRVKRYMRRYKREERMTLTGPNCAGTISPGKAMMGIMPGHIYMPGNVGLIGRSGTLGYEAASQMKAMGIGISTGVGIGGDPINGSSFLDHLERFEQDRAGSGNSPGCHDRRNRRAAGSPGCRLRARSHEKAGARLYRRFDRAQRPNHGPRRCDRHQCRRIGGGKSRNLA